MEVSFSNPSFRRYTMCQFDLEVQSIKIRLLDHIPLPSMLPSFELALADAIDVEHWAQVDAMVVPGNSFEINCTMLLISLNGRHRQTLATNGSRFLSGFLKDRENVVGHFTVWANIATLLDMIPENVSEKPVVMRFTRLQARTMLKAGLPVAEEWAPSRQIPL